MDILLERRPIDVGQIGSTNPRTNIVTHRGVVDVLHQGGEPIRVLGAVQKPCDYASFQWNVVLESTV